VSDEAASVADLDGLGHPVLRLVPPGRRERGDGGLEHRPLEKFQVAEAPQQRLELVDHLCERRHLTQIGMGGLEPVEAAGQRAVRSGCAPGRDRAPPEHDGLGEPQPVA